MAQSFELLRLSGSTDGQAIDVAAIAAGTAATTIHTAHASATDLITIYATNNDADGETRTLNLLWGGTALTEAAGSIVCWLDYVTVASALALR